MKIILASILTFSTAISAQNISGSWAGLFDVRLHIVFSSLQDRTPK
ncbi:hypothetical protein [uncultured Bacteroides sp.]|nr:hypothetical protein [uncultured Bacteroides sp.]